MATEESKQGSPSRMGVLGNALGYVITFITTNWVAVMSAILSYAITAADWTLNIARMDSVRIGVGAFLAILWTSIGITFLRNQKRGQMVRVVHEYAYALTQAGIALLPTEKEGVTYALNFANVGAGPIRLQVEEFRITLGGRTGPEEEKFPDLFLPRAAVKQYRFPTFTKENLPGAEPAKGAIVFTGVYGHPEFPPVRRIKLRINIQLGIEPGGVLKTGESIQVESDTPIRA